jgi:Na+-transporting methylmalonyl-CoA/oxaloacetate decarboxylase gamma subunit
VIPTLASLLPDHPGILESLRFQFVGFMIVMLVLTTLWLLIRLVGTVFKAIPKKAGTLPAEVPTTAGAGDGGPPPEIVAAIAAAVHIVVKEPHRIVSIHPQISTQAAVNMNAWSAEGRRHIFSSHRVR